MYKTLDIGFITTYHYTVGSYGYVCMFIVYYNYTKSLLSNIHKTLAIVGYIATYISL